VKAANPSGALTRGLRLGKLGLTLTGSYLGYQVQNLWLEPGGRDERRRRLNQQASRQIREELQTLKGPVMKLGQMLSMQSALLPEEALAELANLQMRAPAMHPTLARAQFKAALGKHPEEVFREFEPNSFAAASLGQVHRAVTRQGDRVAVKIQYPAIRTAVENDFKLLRSATIPGRISGHVPTALLDEIEQRILKETDYLNEARNIELFHEKLKPLDFVRVPRVWWDLTTERVLTMSFLKGAHLGEWLAPRPSQSLRNLVGHRLLELFWYQMTHLHALHADPHPGNYLFAPDGAIGLVDFGCIKEVPPEFLELIRSLLIGDPLPDDRQQDRLIRLIWGPQPAVNNGVARDVLKAAKEFYKRVYPHADGGCPRGVALDFGDPKLIQGLAQIGSQCARHKLLRPEWVFYKRAELGLYNLLHRLGAKVATEDVLRKYVRPEATPASAP